MRKCLIASAMIAVGVSLPGEVEAQTKTASKATTCHAKPKGAPPAGQWWRYRTDRKNKRRCWFLTSVGKRSATKKRVAKSRRARLPSRLSDDAFPPPRVEEKPSVASRAPAASAQPTSSQLTSTQSARDPLVGRLIPHPPDERGEFGRVGAQATPHAVPHALGNKQQLAPRVSENTASIAGTTVPPRQAAGPAAPPQQPAAAAATPAQPAPAASHRMAESVFASTSYAATSARAESPPPRNQPNAMLLLALLFGSFSIAAVCIRGIVRMARPA